MSIWLLFLLNLCLVRTIFILDNNNLTCHTYLSSFKTCLVEECVKYDCKTVKSLKIRAEHGQQVIDSGILVSFKILQELHMVALGLRFIGANCLSMLWTLKHLNLRGNGITSIDPGAFQNLRELEILDLSDNKLTILNEPFLRLKSLQSLNLAKNNLESLPKNAFIEMDKLQYLYLESNKLRDMPSHAFLCPECLEFVNLAFNKDLQPRCDCILARQLQIGKIKGIECRNISYCGIPKPINCREWKIFVGLYPVNSYSFTCSSKLDNVVTSISLTSSRVTTEKPEKFQKSTKQFLTNFPVTDTPSLTEKNESSHLNKTVCVFTRAFRSCFGISKLKDLFKDPIRNCFELKVLRIEDRCTLEEQIPTLPMAYKCGDVLQTLQLDNNRLSSIPRNLLQNKLNLKLLSLKHNRIKKITDICLQGLLNLRSLDLHSNQLNIKTIHRNAFQDLKLERLDLSSNSLSDLPTAILALPMLKHLFLRSNKITELTNDLSTLINLEVLDLTGNSLQYVPKVIKKLTYLQSLHLSYNGIRKLEQGDFFNMTELKWISLNNNYIAKLDQNVFSMTRNLIGLKLNFNQIFSLSNGIFSCLKYLRNIELAGNPLDCNCDLKWLQLWFKNESRSGAENAICETPLEFRHLTIKQINESLCKESRFSETISCEQLKNMKPISTILPITNGNIKSTKEPCPVGKIPYGNMCILPEDVENIFNEETIQSNENDWLTDGRWIIIAILITILLLIFAAFLLRWFCNRPPKVPRRQSLFSNYSGIYISPASYPSDQGIQQGRTLFNRPNHNAADEHNYLTLNSFASLNSRHKRENKKSHRYSTDSETFLQERKFKRTSTASQESHLSEYERKSTKKRISTISFRSDSHVLKRARRNVIKSLRKKKNYVIYKRSRSLENNQGLKNAFLY